MERGIGLSGVGRRAFINSLSILPVTSKRVYAPYAARFKLLPS
jgi:hypothetical protein